MPYRVIVTGCRNWECPELARSVVARLVARYGPVEIIHGGAEGVDRSFAEAALDAGCGLRLYQAEWEERNHSDGADMCLAVHRDLANSKGTRDCVRQAFGADIPCYLITDDAGTVERIRECP